MNPFGGPLIQGSYIGTMKWIGWRSGTGSPAANAQKRWVWQAGRPADGRPDLALRAEDHGGEHVVVEVLADAREVGDDVDPEGAQVICGADAGEQEQLRRADRAAADDDLVGMHVLDAVAV